MTVGSCKKPWTKETEGEAIMSLQTKHMVLGKLVIKRLGFQGDLVNNSHQTMRLLVIQTNLQDLSTKVSRSYPIKNINL